MSYANKEYSTEDIKAFFRKLINKVDRAERIHHFHVEREPSFIAQDTDKYGELKDTGLGTKITFSIDFGHLENSNDLSNNKDSLEEYFNRLDQQLSNLGECDSAMEFAPHFTKPFRAAVKELSYIKTILDVQNKPMYEYFGKENEEDMYDNETATNKWEF